MTPHSTSARWKDLSKKIAPIASLGALMLLSGCSEAMAVSTDDSRRTEAATERMKAEQARTNQAEARKTAERAASYKRELALSEIQRGMRQPATRPQ